MPSARVQDATDSGGEERGSFLRRLIHLPARAATAARRHALLALVLLCGTTIIVFSAASAFYYSRTHLSYWDRSVTTDAALRLLDEGDFEGAQQMAHRLRQKIGHDYQRMGHPLFVQGVILAEEAKQLGHGEEQRTIYLVAARYLAEARTHGFPVGRTDQGLFLLAECLYKAEHYAESLPVLHDAYQLVPAQKFTLARRLSTAYLRDTVPNLREARRFTKIWLQDPSLTDDDRALATLQLAEVHLASKATEQCQQALAQIPADSRYRGQAQLLAGRLAMLEGDQILAALQDSGMDDSQGTDKYRTAIRLLSEAQAGDDPSGVVMRQSQYLIGLCQLKLGDLRAATAAFDRTEKSHFGTAESFAAMLTHADVLLQQGLPGPALEMYVRALNEAGQAELYQNYWVPMRDLQGRLTNAVKQLLVKQEFEAALSLLDAAKPLSPPEATAIATAETHEAWGEYLESRAGTQGVQKDWDQLSRARRHFRQAGTEYRQLAQLRYATAFYATDLWKAGESFRRGQNYQVAVDLLQAHLQCVPHAQSPPAIVSLGECYLSLGQYNAAINVLEECISTFPKHPETYRARLLASIAYCEKREPSGQQQTNQSAPSPSQRKANLARARQLLIDNLHNTSLEPRSRYWQQSLLDYGKLLYRDAHYQEHLALEQRKAALETTETETDDQQALEELKVAHDLFQEAVRHLESAVERETYYATQEGRPPQACEARYYVGEAFRHSAKFKRYSLDSERSQSRRITLRQEMTDDLRRAAENYRTLQDQLARKQNHTVLSPVEDRLLRNSYFAYGDTLFQLEDYDAAISAYVDATNRYQRRPEALEALVQCASCYRELHQPEEARGTMVQAESVLSRIPDNIDYTKTTRYDRTQWEKLIAWLGTL